MGRLPFHPNLTRGVSCGVILTSWALFLASYCGSFWTVSESYHFGIWQFCGQGTNGTCLYLLTYYWDFRQDYHTVCEVLASIACMFYIVTVVMSLLWWTVNIDRMQRGITGIGLSVAGFSGVSGSMGLSTAVVWAVNTRSSDLGWGWYLALFPAIMVIITCMALCFVFFYSRYKPKPRKEPGTHMPML